MDKIKDYLSFSEDRNIVGRDGEIVVNCGTNINQKSIKLRLKLINILFNKNGFIFEGEIKYIFEEATDEEVKKMLRKKRIIYKENLNGTKGWIG